MLDDPARFKVLRAGRKWRKTSMGISWLIEGALETGLACPYIAPSFKQAKKIAWNDHIPRILDHFKDQGVPYKKNDTELTIKFPNGGSLELYGVENKEALRGISNWGRVFGDEYDDWTEDIWPLIIRPNLIPHKAPAIIAGTPKGKRGLWRLGQNPDFKAFHYSSYDNPDLDPEELDDLVREYKQYGNDYYQQEIMAEYMKPVGVVYGEFNEERQWLPFEYDSKLPLHMSWDFGINDPTALIWIQPYGSEFRVIDYYEASDVNIEHFVQVINSKPYGAISLHTGDIAGRARTLTTGKSVIDELATHKIYVTTNPIPDIPTQIRMAHKHIPRLFVSKSNPNTGRFVDVLNNYRYPEKAENLVNQSNEIPIHDQWSHGARAMEYYFYNMIDTLNPEPKHELKFSDTGRLIS